MMEFKDYELKDQVLIGLYIYIVRGKDGEYWLGKEGGNDIIFKYLKVEKSSYVKNILGYKSSGNFPETRTLEDLNKVIKQLQIDCLLKEAKEKYPVGTKYYPTHTGKCNGHFVVDYDQEIVFDDFYICLKNPDGLYCSTTRNGEIYDQVLWHENNWAEIITEEPKQPKINTYGLKVGDALMKDIIIAWAKHGENRQQTGEKGGKWHKANGTFIDNRTIKSFKNIDGVVGFLVSGTSEVYLRAEGFKEFAESFDKPKFEVGKWYKYKGYYVIKYLKKEARNSKYAIVYSDIITYDNKYESFPEGNTGVGYVDEGTWYELTDLSEIQEYLPDGHPDKTKAQPEYIVGKWYKMGKWIGKFKELDGDKFRVFKSGTPFDNYKSFDNGYLSIKHQGTPVLITDMTEVYKLFPEEKPKESEFEVSDWVVVESWYYEKIPLPQTCQISRIIINGDKVHYEILLNKDHYGNNKSWGFKKGEFRHATSEEVDREIERRQFIKYKSPSITQIVKSDLEWEIISPKINMLLSIDDEELPMVNIIKVKTIKQLLNND